VPSSAARTVLSPHRLLMFWGGRCGRRATRQAGWPRCFRVPPGPAPLMRSRSDDQTRAARDPVVYLPPPHSLPAGSTPCEWAELPRGLSTVSPNGHHPQGGRRPASAGCGPPHSAPARSLLPALGPTGHAFLTSVSVSTTPRGSGDPRQVSLPALPNGCRPGERPVCARHRTPLPLPCASGWGWRMPGCLEDARRRR
jgi:hypothetical protein